MRERYYDDREREHITPYFGEAYDKQYCEMLLADAAEADIPAKSVDSPGRERISFFKMAGELLIKSWRSLRPKSHNSAAKKNRPAP